MRRIRVRLGHNTKCLEHGFFGGLPCPWPDCSNGINEDGFEEDLMIEGIEIRRWKRRQWSSPNGGLYYSWDDGKTPCWFQAPQTFWNQARRLKLTQKTQPDVVYHYTSLEGFIGIIKSQSIWMTEFSYLNDRREVRYGMDLLIGVIQRIQRKTSRKDVKGLLSTWASQLSGSKNRVCITSFSGEGDSLSQWRAYGPVAVGLPVSDLSLHVDQSRFQPIEYNQRRQRKLVETYVNHLISAFQLDVDENRLNRIPDVYHKHERLLELAVFFKDPAFRSEKEYRLAYIDYPEVLESIGMRSPPRLFRAARGKIIPYVPSTEILRSKDRDFPLKISEIVLGPESDDLLEQGVCELLSEYGLADVNVRRSLVPLRS